MGYKCLGTISPILEATLPAERPTLSVHACSVMMKNFIYARASWALPPAKVLFKKEPVHSGAARSAGGEHLGIGVGDWIEVKTAEEVRATLDKNGKTRGLRYMPEMWKFCGKRFRVFKKVERVNIEETGEIRVLKSPTFFLEGVFCDGEFHGHCDRSCFLFWKEDWLRKIPSLS